MESDRNKVKQEGTFGIYPVEKKKTCGHVEVRSSMFPNKEDKYQDLTTYLHNQSEYQDLAAFWYHQWVIMPLSKQWQ